MRNKEVTEGKKLEMKLATIPPPLHKRGLVVTDELINHTHHSADSCQCRSSTPTPQLHSCDCMCEHIPGKISPLLTWKHNHTHACTYATC